MADHLPQVNFTDGEGIDEDDFDRLQSLSSQRTIERASRFGGLGGSASFGHATGGGPFTPGGAEVGQVDPRSAGLIAANIYTPDPLGFEMSDFSIDGSGDMIFSHGPQVIIQKVGGSTPGSAPPGFAEANGGALVYTLDTDEAGVVGIARPVANPRIDSIGFRLGHAVGNPLPRDFEDSATRALSTTNPNKDQDTSFEIELIQGVEAASPAVPSQSAGFSRFVTVTRETGETSLNPNNVQLHAFPMRLRTETVWGRNMAFDSTDWTPNGAQPSIQKVGAGSDPLLALSRTMGPGSRLVGIGIANGSQVNDIDIEIVAHRVLTSGSFQIDVLQDIGSGNPISTSDNLGFTFAGLADFTAPYWGNGKTYGPLLGVHTVNPLEDVEDTQIGVRIANSVSVNNGQLIYYVRFYYLE